MSEASIENSILLAKILGDFEFEPDVGADPDGFVVLEWYRDRNDQCLLTVSDDGKAILNLISDGIPFDETFDISRDISEISSMLADFGIFRKENP